MLIRGRDCPTEPSLHGCPKRVYLRQGVLPDVTQAAVATLEAGFRAEVHTHPTMFENYFVLSGRAIYELGGVEYEVEAGDMVVVPPGTPHRQWVLEGPHTIFYWGIATRA
jgi:quercetin dioxygenase-like cupin family protein